MNNEIKKRIITSILLILMLLAMHRYAFIMIIATIVIATIVWIEFYALISKIFSKKKKKEKLLRFLYKSISLLYLLFLVFLIFAIESHYLDLKLYLIYSILVSILSDIGGLIFGKIFKGKKLTKISPNKTISGSIGSLILSLTLIPFFWIELASNNLLNLVIITMLISITAQLGDLFISLLKRKAKVKDTSNLLPGHGGALDRVDGIIFAIPLGVLLLNIT
jgi:phosphatidate cytidylyltransferase